MVSDCATWRCDAESLPHMAFCYEHVPRYYIPKPTECPECGYTGNQHTTIHDNMYFCGECDEMFDPRVTDYLERLRERHG